MMIKIIYAKDTMNHLLNIVQHIKKIFVCYAKQNMKEIKLLNLKIY